MCRMKTYTNNRGDKGDGLFIYVPQFVPLPPTFAFIRFTINHFVQTSVSFMVLPFFHCFIILLITGILKKPS